MRNVLCAGQEIMGKIAETKTRSTCWFPQRRSDQFPGTGFLSESDHTEIVNRDGGFYSQLHIFGEAACLAELSHLRNLLYNSHVSQMPAAVLATEHL